MLCRNDAVQKPLQCTWCLWKGSCVVARIFGWRVTEFGCAQQGINKTSLSVLRTWLSIRCSNGIRCTCREHKHGQLHFPASPQCCCSCILHLTKVSIPAACLGLGPTTPALIPGYRTTPPWLKLWIQCAYWLCIHTYFASESKCLL